MFPPASMRNTEWPSRAKFALFKISSCLAFIDYQTDDLRKRPSTRAGTDHDIVICRCIRFRESCSQPDKGGGERELKSHLGQYGQFTRLYRMMPRSAFWTSCFGSSFEAVIYVCTLLGIHSLTPRVYSQCYELIVSIGRDGSGEYSFSSHTSIV